MIEVSGVRSSCETSAKNSSLRRSASSSARLRSLNWPIWAPTVLEQGEQLGVGLRDLVARRTRAMPMKPLPLDDRERRSRRAGRRASAAPARGNAGSRSTSSIQRGSPLSQTLPGRRSPRPKVDRDRQVEELGGVDAVGRPDRGRAQHAGAPRRATHDDADLPAERLAERLEHAVRAPRERRRLREHARDRVAARACSLGAAAVGDVADEGVQVSSPCRSSGETAISIGNSRPARSRASSSCSSPASHRPHVGADRAAERDADRLLRRPAEQPLGRRVPGGDRSRSRRRSRTRRRRSRARRGSSAAWSRTVRSVSALETPGAGAAGEVVEQLEVLGAERAAGHAGQGEDADDVGPRDERQIHLVAGDDLGAQALDGEVGLAQLAADSGAPRRARGRPCRRPGGSRAGPRGRARAPRRSGRPGRRRGSRRRAHPARHRPRRPARRRRSGRRSSSSVRCADRAADAVEPFEARLARRQLVDRALELGLLGLELGVLALELVAVALERVGHRVERAAELADLAAALLRPRGPTGRRRRAGARPSRRGGSAAARSAAGSRRRGPGAASRRPGRARRRSARAATTRRRGAARSVRSRALPRDQRAEAAAQDVDARLARGGVAARAERGWCRRRARRR